ncbi:MAG: SH3 domain-containing protein [Aggregatilineales bacterium]
MRAFNITVASSFSILSICFILAFTVGNQVLANDMEPTPTPEVVAIARVQVSETPIRVNIPTSIPIPTSGSVFSPTPTFTATNEGPVQLRVIGADPVNVRSLADIESDILGTIRPEETYSVIGKLFMWYQIMFDASPNGRGWVFEGLVEVIGDVPVPDLSLATATPQLDAQIVAETQTQAVIDTVPGGDLTATANSRVIAPPIGNSGAEAGSGDSVNASNLMPTFTYPPNLDIQRPIVNESNEATPMPEVSGGSPVSTSDEIAPIVPIVILFGFGLAGLLINSLRR